METKIITPEEIHFIDISENIEIFLHTKTLQIYPFDKTQDLSKFLHKIKDFGIENTATQYSTTDFDELLTFITDTIYSSPSSLVVDKETDKMSFNSIILPISAKCNLACPYCFAKSNKNFNFASFTEDDIDKILNFLVLQQNNDETPLNLIFFGGEPLLNKQIILYTIKTCKEKYPNKKVTYSITTNGTILDKNLIDIFKENNFAVLTSLDGPDNEFNLRYFKNGKKSIYKVLENLQILKKNGLQPHIRATLLNTNPHICETFEFFEKLEIPFTIVFAYSSENKTHTYSEYNSEVLFKIKQQFEQLLKIYLEKLRNGNIIYNKALNDFCSTIRFRVIGKKPCSAGIDLFTIMANGDIFSCSHFMNNSEYKLGNIFTNFAPLPDYIVSDIDNITECNSCWLKYLCKGGCFAQKLAEGISNRNAKPQNECELEKMLWTFYIKLYYYIKTDTEIIKHLEQINKE
jgi:uncharacterized protein